jgi:hypothetical protein
VARVQQAYGAAIPGGYALIGPIGSGKTAALDAVSKRCTEPITGDYESLLTSRAALDRVIIERMVSSWGVDPLDAAWKSLRFQPGSRESLLPDERFQLIAATARARGPALVALDEVHVLERLDDSEAATAADALARLAEALRGGGGALFLSMTPAAWTKLGQRGRDRFLPIHAAPRLDEAEIEAVIRDGLGREQDGPRDHEKATAERLAECESMRVLHERLHLAWDRAFQENAATLRAEHVG